MSFTDFLAAQSAPDRRHEIRDVLSGHLCRCTGYAGIVKAVKEVASEYSSDSHYREIFLKKKK